MKFSSEKWMFKNSKADTQNLVLDKAEIHTKKMITAHVRVQKE